MGHLPAIDGLRAVAVLSVIAYHAGMPAGYVGVDVFFVISGYLITRILLERPPLVEFYARRARRILPAAFLVVLVTLALSFLLLPSAGDVARSAAAAGVFVANVFFQSTTGGYWDASSESMPLLHLWSLSVEEQFYLLWPLVVLFGGVNWRFARQNRRNPSYSPFPASFRLMLLVFLGSLALYAYLSWANPEAAFYQTPARAWELAAGGLVAAFGFGNQGFVSRAERQPVGTRVDPVRRAEARAELFEEGEQFGGSGDQVGVPLLDRAGGDDDMLKVGRVLFVGDTSAPTLLAFPTRLNEPRPRSVFAHILPRARLIGPHILRNAAAFVLQHASRFALPIVLLACLVPMPVWAAQPLAVLGATLIVANPHSRVLEARPLVWVGLISYSLYLWHWPLLALDRATRAGEAPIETRLALCAIAVVLAVLTYRYVEQPFRRMRFRAGRTVSVGTAFALALSVGAWSMAPHPVAKPNVMARPLQCEPYGPGVPVAVQAPRCVTKARKVVLWGDSYTTPWQPLAKSYAAKEGLPLTMFSDSGCPTLAGVTATLQNATITRTCREFNDRTLAWIQTNKADTVVVAAYYVELFQKHPDQGQRGLANLVAALKPHVRRIVIVAPTPILMDEPGQCERAGVECVTKADYDAQAAGIRATLAGLGVEVVDPSGFYCPDGCRWRGLYSDMHHVTVESVEAFIR